MFSIPCREEVNISIARSSHRFSALTLTAMVILAAMIPACSQERSVEVGKAVEVEKTVEEEKAVEEEMAVQEEKAVEVEMKIHRLTSTQTAPYDAFAYVNRIDTELAEDETPKQFAGRLFGRLANQEGRILLKLPPGFTPDAYLGLKTFYQTFGTEKAGNCVSCHMPPDFTDGASRKVSEADARETPGLREVSATAPYLHDDSKETLEDVLREKIRLSDLAREGKIEGIDEEMKLVYITEEDIPQLVEFLKTFADAGKEGFRQLVLDAKLMDEKYYYQE